MTTSPSFPLPPLPTAVALAATLLALPVLALAYRVRRRRRLRRRFREPIPGAFPYRARKTLLTAGERAFWKVLREALGEGTAIAPKVRLADVIACDRAARDPGYGKLIGNKHVDFVVIDARTAEILLAVELDDRSHLEPARRYRDEFLDRALAAAGVRLVRVRSASRYCARRLRVRLSLP
jgi:hypothetical protein